MEDELKWIGTSFELVKNENNTKLITLLEENNIAQIEDRKYKVVNQKNILIFEVEYIEQEAQFLEITEKLQEKDYKTELKYYNNDIFEKLPPQLDEVEIYQKVINTNNISNFHKSNLNISINTLEKIVKSHKQKYVITIYIMIFLANKTIKKGDEFTFLFEDIQQQSTIKMNFKDIEEYELFVLYDWIVNENHYPKAYEVKLNIIRKILSSRNLMVKDSFKKPENILKEGKYAFNRIIRGETDKYFEQVQQLKQDFLIIAENQSKLNRTLHLSVFGWVGYIGLTILDFVKDYEGDSIFYTILCSKSEKTRVLLLMLLFAWIIIFLVYAKEVYDSKKTYENLKSMYEEEFQFQEFDKYLEEPVLNFWYKVIFSLILFALIVKIIGCAPLFELLKIIFSV